MKHDAITSHSRGERLKATSRASGSLETILRPSRNFAELSIQSKCIATLISPREQSFRIYAYPMTAVTDDVKKRWVVRWTSKSMLDMLFSASISSQELCAIAACVRLSRGQPQMLLRLHEETELFLWEYRRFDVSAGSYWRQPGSIVGRDG
jgi:hypothetical protein